MVNKWQEMRPEAIKMGMHARTRIMVHDLKTEQQLLASNSNKTAAKLPRCRQRDALPIQCAWPS
jgi:hypothetical protein